jgi:hypothetical protein
MHPFSERTVVVHRSSGIDDTSSSYEGAVIYRGLGKEYGSLFKNGSGAYPASGMPEGFKKKIFFRESLQKAEAQKIISYSRENSPKISGKVFPILESPRNFPLSGHGQPGISIVKKDNLLPESALPGAIRHNPSMPSGSQNEKFFFHAFLSSEFSEEGVP